MTQETVSGEPLRSPIGLVVSGTMGEAGGLLGRSRSKQKPRRLIDAEVKDARQFVYYLDDHEVVAVLDHDVVLEPSGYEVDIKTGTIRLVRRPAGPVRLLVAGKRTPQAETVDQSLENLRERLAKMTKILNPPHAG